MAREYYGIRLCQHCKKTKTPNTDRNDQSNNATNEEQDEQDDADNKTSQPGDMSNSTKQKPYIVSAGQCLLSMVASSNENRYLICTQDATLRAQLREIGGIPTLYISKSVLILEPLSPATIEKRTNFELTKQKEMAKEVKEGHLQLQRAPDQNDVLEDGTSPTDATSLNETLGALIGGTGALHKRKIGPKAPNPLSCKKKKPEGNSSSTAREIIESRKEKKREKQRLRRQRIHAAQGETCTAPQD